HDAKIPVGGEDESTVISRSDDIAVDLDAAGVDQSLEVGMIRGGPAKEGNASGPTGGKVDEIVRAGLERGSAGDEQVTVHHIDEAGSRPGAERDRSTGTVVQGSGIQVESACIAGLGAAADHERAGGVRAGSDVNVHSSPVHVERGVRAGADHHALLGRT